MSRCRTCQEIDTTLDFRFNALALHRNFHGSNQGTFEQVVKGDRNKAITRKLLCGELAESNNSPFYKDFSFHGIG